MLAILLLVLAPLLMWLAQSAALLAMRRPLRLALGGNDLPGPVEAALRAATHVAMLGVLVGYPLLHGLTPWTYYARFFPTGERPAEFAWGLAAATLYLTLLYLAWTLTDQVRFEIRHRRSRLIRKLVLAPVAGLLIALVEELLFRAVLLEDLLQTLTPAPAVSLGVIGFAAAHYVRRVKRYWTIVGHLALGGLLCTAYLATGALWLPIGLHAAGVTLLTAVRPFVRYTGPAWLVGASIFPYAGVIGVASLTVLATQIALRFGRPT